MSKKKSNIHTEYFEDINLYKLEGVNKIKGPSSFPYIQIEYVSDEERDIIFHASKEVMYHRKYKKQNDIWVSSFNTNGDTCNIITYEYVTQKKIVDLYYCNNDNLNDSLLTDVSVLEDSIETIYDLGNVSNIKPDIKVIQIAKTQSEFIFTKEINIKNGILTIKEKRRDRNSKLLSSEITCYEISNHSYFWWRYFGWTKKRINCK